MQPTTRRWRCPLRRRRAVECASRATEFEALTAAAGRAHARPRVRKVLRDAKAGKDEVQGVVMVGGSTRMPTVQAAVGATSSAARR